MAKEASKDKKSGMGAAKEKAMDEKLKLESESPRCSAAAGHNALISNDLPLRKVENAATSLMDIVLNAERDYQAKKKDLPDSNKIEEKLLETAGIVSNEQYAFVMIDMGSPDIGKFTSACGTAGLPVFSNVDVIRFLRENKIGNIIGVVYDHEAQDTYDEGKIPLCAIVLPIDENLGSRFEEMVSKIGGSFRCEKLNLETISKDERNLNWHWTIYESE